MSTEQPDSEEDEDIRYFVRIGQTDLDGTASVERALTDMNGIGRRTARVIADEVGVDRRQTLGLLEEDVIDDIVDLVQQYEETVPAWLTNRRKDFFTGDDDHVTGNDLTLTRQQDVNRMKMISSYKGVRHERGQKVRGQRTKSTGRSEGTVGVNVEEIREEMDEEEEEQ